jgi:hypothetical protein
MIPHQPSGRRRCLPPHTCWAHDGTRASSFDREGAPEQGPALKVHHYLGRLHIPTAAWPTVAIRRYVPDGRHLGALLNPNSSEDSSAPGAASCRAVLRSCPVAAVRAAAQVPSPQSRPERPSAPKRRDPGQVGPPSGWSPVARMSGRRPGRSLPCPRSRSRRGDVCPAGRADIQRPGVRCPGVRCPGVRCIQVSARTGLRCPRRRRRPVRALDPGVARCGGPPRPGAAGRRARGPRAAWAPACIGPDRKGWFALAVPGSHEVDRSQGRRLVGVPAAAPPWPRGPTRALVEGQGAGRWGSMGPSRCSSAPQGVLGRSLAWCRPWPGPGGDDHAAWSLGQWWSRGVQFRRAHSVWWGAACGRSAAAAGEERCPLGADRSLTSENSGGRDRV